MISENPYAKYQIALIDMGVPAKTVVKFLQHHKRNQAVWKYFERYTLAAIEAKKVLGAKAIAERVRWEVEIVHNSTYKISNSFIAYYARIFEIKYPQYKGYFKKRPIRGLKETQSWSDKTYKN